MTAWKPLGAFRVGAPAKPVHNLIRINIKYTFYFVQRKFYARDASLKAQTLVGALDPLAKPL